ncbi:MAG: hypothetical protein LBB85_02235 [Dysgonamonadaceae bacterium]|jgi:hypothetical protein|nr:hypothetical protein [Dysgonamonadaceae bacterium]
MKKKKKKKKIYVSPTVKIRVVVLERCIADAVGSGVSPQLQSWGADEIEGKTYEEGGDIYITWN